MAFPRAAKNIILAVLLLYTCGLAFFTAFIIISMKDLRSVEALEYYSPPIPTSILDVNNKIITRFYSEKREVIPFNDVSRHAINALIATEDESFFRHSGINPVRIIKAFLVNISSGKIAQGGSTITQQLAGNIFTGRRKNLLRKIRELWYTIKIEKRYTKKEILSFYFNQIWYGHGCYGIQAASRFYFGKDARNLTLAEASLLIGIQPNPRIFSPLSNPAEAMRRHRIVLNNLVRAGNITAQEGAEAYNSFWIEYRSRIIAKQRTAFDMQDNHAPYFVEYLRPRLEKLVGYDMVYKGGLNVYTTLDINRQKAAEKYIKEVLANQDIFFQGYMQQIKNYIDRLVLDHLDLHSQLYGLDQININQTKIKQRMNEILATRVTRQLKNFSLIFGIDPALNITHFAELAGLSALENKTECAFISIEPSTGYISAMIGGSGFSYNNQMNRAVQMYRQIGSIMKPFVYAAAIDTKKITAATLFNDTPIAFENPDGSLYIPQNYSGKYYGYIRARTALQKSINATTLQVLELATIEKTREYCSKMFRSLTAEDQEKKFPYNMTMGLGSGIFSPLELATAYAVFANDGKEVIPLSIRYITDRDGKILRNLEEEFYGDRIPSQVIDKATAFIAADIMRNVLEPGGTAYNENLIKEFEHPSGGKTGTSGNWRDAWFAGFNKYLSTVIWLGYDDSRLSLGKGRAGGTLAAPVWIKYNRDVLMNKKNYPFEKPESVIEAEICTDSGKLPGPRCRRTMTEYFLPGTVPEEFCDFHSRENLQEMEFAETIRNMKKSDRPDNDDKEKRRRFRTPKSGTMNSNTGIDFSSFW